MNPMFPPILLPLDGSPLAERALPYAEELACAAGAQLLLVRAVAVHAVRGPNAGRHHPMIGIPGARYADGDTDGASWAGAWRRVASPYAAERGW